MKQRPLAEFERALLRSIDIGAGEVCRQEVRRELQAVEIALDALGEDFDGAGLGQPRRAFHQQMAVAQQSDQHPIDEVRLANDQPARMRLEFLKLLCDAHCWLR